MATKVKAVKAAPKTKVVKSKPKAAEAKAVKAAPKSKVSVTEVAPPVEPTPEVYVAPQVRYFDLGESVGRLNEDGTFTKLTLANGVQSTEDIDVDVNTLTEISKADAYSRVF